MKKFNSVIALLLVSNLLFGDVLELASPGLSASSPYYKSDKSTSIVINNPALTADIQRYTFDLSYLLLAGLTGDETGMGHSISLGGALPSKYGVLSTTLNLLLTDGLTTSNLKVGTAGHINLNFSKEIYSDLYFGAGLTTLLGSDDTGFDWGLGLNLGFVKESGNLSEFFKDFRWGVSLNNLGKGYKHSSIIDATAPAPAFTPKGFVEFSPYKSDKLNLNIASEISLPSVSDFNLELGVKAVLYDKFIIDTSLNVNVREIVSGDLDRLIPSLFLGYDLNIGADEAQVSLSGNPYSDGIWAFGASGTMPLGSKDTNPPIVTIDYEERQYVSPNFDGIKDELNFPITVEDERYIAGYEVTIRDNFGKIVKKIVNKDERPENESFKNLWSKLINPITGIPVPESFRWDGKKDDGELVPDGEYNFTTKFVDDNGNATITAKEKFIIDVTNPSVEISSPTGLDLIFSPNGDGNKDVFNIPQSGSSEVRWYCEITDFLGNSIKSGSWDNEALSSFEWNGKDDSGQLVPDGVYQYRVTSTDLAGNSVEDFVDNIIINNKQPPIGITIDTNSFSPNGDSVKDYMEFILDIPVKTGIINWNLVIKNKSGLVVNEFSTEKLGYSVIEDNIRFDGKDSTGKYLKEGIYTGVLSVVYQNGHSPNVESPDFNIDITAPKADVKTKYSMFSPNGDDSKDQIIFNQSSSLEEEWNGEILDEFGTSVFNTNWKGEIDRQFAWNGKDDNGELLDDGTYTYLLSSTDKSGNSYKGEPAQFELNTSSTSIELVINKEAFSPNGKKDSIELKALVDSSIDLKTYSLEILDGKERLVKTISKNENIDNLFKWFGLNSSGTVAKDETYYGRIRGEFENGNRVVSLTSPILLDTKVPEVNVKRLDKFNVFSPNGDGQKDFITMRQTTSNEEKWTGEIKNQAGDTVFTTSWSGIAPKEFVFNGKDMDNKNLPDGKYFYSLKAVDIAGNIGLSKDIPVEIDTENVELFVSTDKTHFSPNSDRVKDTIEFIPQIKKTDGIESISYQVLNKSLETVYSKDVTTGFTDSVIWNGNSSTGKKLNDNEYTVKLIVNYKRGDSPSASTGFIIDTVAPVAEVITKNSIFSPNGDGNRDFVEISNISDDSAMWTLSIVDSKNRIVKESNLNGLVTKTWNFDGRGEDLTILENGKYIYSLKAVDEAGNSYSSKDITLNMDNSTSTVVVSNDHEVFSPNKDNIKDKVTFSTRVEALSSVESWSFTIVDKKENVIKEFTGKSKPKDIIWDGLVQSTKVKASEGIYKGIMNITHANGNNPISSTPEFELDSVFPVIDLSVKNSLFSPNGDNLKDAVILNQRAIGEDLYHGAVYDDKNTLIKEWYWKDRLTTHNWDGKDSSGNITTDGSYKYVVETTDLGGNKTVESIRDITIDTTETDIFITYKKPVFAPDLTRTLGGQIFGLIVNNRVGVESWSINISGKSGVIKTLRGSETIPNTLEWDGRDNSGGYSHGILTAKFNVIYKKGNSPVYSTKEFVADSEAPLIKVTTSPTPFSPDDDFVDDELSIELGVKDLSSIDSWSFDIKDPKGNDFISFNGEGKPGKKIIWDGKSSKGELVQAAEEYKYIMSVKDAAGHTGTFRGEIPIDILVIKEGNKLKIKVSSIIFQPNSAVLALSGNNGESNNKILKRLSEILDKYSSYKIVVEGHANNIYGNRVTKSQRNSLIDFSKERAEEVKKSLKKLGISGGRMTTVGIGGDEPVVEFDDAENAWKNRRVEFVLVK